MGADLPAPLFAFLGEGFALGALNHRDPVSFERFMIWAGIIGAILYASVPFLALIHSEAGMAYAHVTGASDDDGDD